MKRQNTSATKSSLRDLDCRELHSIEGGVVAVRDEEGNIIADCIGRIVTLPGGSKIWVPHGTIVFGAEG